MKKLYLFVALLLAMVGIGVSNALVAIVEGDPLDSDALEDGMQVFISNNITNGNGYYNSDTGDYTHTFGSYRCMVDDSNEEGILSQGLLFSAENAKTTQIWTLVEAKSDDNGTWYYIKNGETGRYIGIPAEALYRDDDGTLSTALPMTGDEAKAMPFLFKTPAEAWELMDVEVDDEALLDLVQVMTDNETYPLVILAHFAGQFVPVNCLYSKPVLTPYTNWAALWTVIEGECVYDPVTEFEQYMESITIPTYSYGDYPGCVVEAEEAQATIERLNELAATLDDPDAYEESDFEAFLAEAQALVAKLETFTFKPMVPGYYRFISALNNFEDRQGVKKAMYAVTGAAKWGTLDEGEEIMEDVTEEVTDPETGETTTEVIGQQGTGRHSGMEQVWVVEEKDGKLYVKNLKTQQYFANASSMSASVAMGNSEKWVEFRGYPSGDFNLYVEGTGYALHTGSHASGNGVSGNIVGWNAGAGTGSAWIMQPLSEEDVHSLWSQEDIEAAQRAVEFARLLAAAQAAVQEARDYFHPVCDIIDPVIDRDNKIFTTADNDGTHVTSPCSDLSEGNIDNLLDGIEGDPDNFWHSDWHGTYKGTWCNGYHYVQFNLKAPYQKLALYYVPRVRPEGNTNSFEGWPEEFIIYYTSTPDDEESWKRGVSFGEGDIDTDYNIDHTIVNQLRQYYLPFYIDEGAQYVRVVCTKGFSWRYGHKFWMAGEMNFCTYEGTVIYDEGTDLLAKADLQGDGAATALLELIEEAEYISEPTAEQLAALRAAHDAFMAVYTSPAVMSNLIAKAKTLLNSVEYGNEPGQKPEAAYTALDSAIATAEAWMVANMRSCTLAEYNAAVADLQDAIDAWDNYGIQTGISSVSSANQAVIYNLNGQRVTKPQSGLYIIGGKKVVVR